LGHGEERGDEAIPRRSKSGLKPVRHEIAASPVRLLAMTRPRSGATDAPSR
jgi:hypothetical protein